MFPEEMMKLLVRQEGHPVIRNVLFDLDDTLLDFRQAERIALTKTLKFLKVPPTEKILKRYSEINAAQWKRLERGEISREEVNVGRYRLLFQEFEIAASPEETTAYYDRQLSIGHYFIAGAEELLLTISPIYRIYLVTNGTEAVQRKRIQSAGLERYVDEVFISEIIGVDKPDVEFFRQCFSHIPDFSANETVIVGDSLTSDIQGACNVGIQSVWFNPHNLLNDTPIRPDFEIQTLQELPKILQHL